MNSSKDFNMGQSILPSEVGISRELARKFLQFHKWIAQTTADHREYWSINGGQLMPLEQAFKVQIEAAFPRTRTPDPQKETQTHE